MMVAFSLCVEMISLFGGFQCQQHEFAISGFAQAIETNSPRFFSKLRSSTMIFTSYFIHLVIVGACLKELPFNVVLCPKSCWGICFQHQLLLIFIGQSFNYKKVHVSASKMNLKHI
jgi:hypothetical protein